MTSRFPGYLLEVLWNRLLAIAEEQAQVIMRTAFSTIVRESGDLSAAIFDRRARMVAQARTGTPGHINTMARGMRHFLAAFPPDSLEPGDVLIGNDPYRLSGQLNDISLVTPVFHRGRAVAFFASCCHMVDIGGLGLGADAREMYEEGLFIPFCKLFVRGQENHDVVRFITSNVRTPREVMGDLHAQAAAGDVGAVRLAEMLGEFDLADIETLSDEIIDRSEAAVRQAVRAFPEGRFTFACQHDGFEAPLPIQLVVYREGDTIVADYAGSAGQVGRGINVPLGYTVAYSTYAIKCVIAPDVPNNEGCFIPIDIRAPERSILNPVPPAATAARHIIGHFLPTVVLGALEQAVPDRVIADSAAGLWVTPVAGKIPGGEPFTFTFFACGGMGARPTKDGLSATSFPSGIQVVSTEVIESVSPLVFRQRELRADSGGAGKHRGGLGQTIRFEVRGEGPVTLSPMYDRVRFAPRGTAGGGEGGAGAVLGGDGRVLPSKGRVEVGSGEVITLLLPGGGGYGPPAERAPEAVAADVEEGYVSAEAARKTYAKEPRS